MVDVNDYDELIMLIDSMRNIMSLKDIYVMGFEHKGNVIINISDYYNGYGCLDTTDYIQGSLGTLIGEGFVSSEIDPLELLNIDESEINDENRDEIEKEKIEIEADGYAIEVNIKNYITEAMSKASRKTLSRIIKRFSTVSDYYSDTVYEYFDPSATRYNSDKSISLIIAGPVYDPETLVFDIIGEFLKLYEEYKEW